jgi:hypothetical protein
MAPGLCAYAHREGSGHKRAMNDETSQDGQLVAGPDQLGSRGLFVVRSIVFPHGRGALFPLDS